MTLTTQVRVVDPYPIREVFDWLTDFVGGDDPRFKGERPRWFEDSDWRSGQNKTLRNHAMQGLDALVWITYGVDGNMVLDACEQGTPECAFTVFFDTPYAFENDKGGGCGDQHAYILQQLGRWLDEHKLRWFWCDEFTDEWYEGGSQITELGDPEKGAFGDRVSAGR